MDSVSKDLYIEELELQNRQLLDKIAQLERAHNYYPGFPAPGPGQREIRE